MNIIKEPIDAETEIRYQFAVGATSVTATSPVDFTLKTPDEQILDFIDPEVQQLGLVVRIIDDALMEEIETFQLELFVGEQPHFRLGNITRVTVTITDDDDECEDEGSVGREGGRREEKE